MSFIKTLATLAIGFAAARGVDKFRQMGGMTGMKDALTKSKEPGGAVDDLGRLAERLGVPGGADAVRTMASRAGAATEAGIAAAESGFSTLMNSLAAGAGAAAQAVSEVTGFAGGAASEMSEAEARLLIRAMIEAAKADGAIDDDERSRIMALLGNASEQERVFVESALTAPADLPGLVGDVADDMKAKVYATSRMAIRADTLVEQRYLDHLALALGLDPAVRARIDAGQFGSDRA